VLSAVRPCCPDHQRASLLPYPFTLVQCVDLDLLAYQFHFVALFGQGGWVDASQRGHGCLAVAVAALHGALHTFVLWAAPQPAGQDESKSLAQ